MTARHASAASGSLPSRSSASAVAGSADCAAAARTNEKKATLIFELKDLKRQMNRKSLSPFRNAKKKANSTDKYRPAECHAGGFSAPARPAYAAGGVFCTCAERKTPLAGVYASGAGCALLF